MDLLESQDEADLAEMLSRYDIGKVKAIEALTSGTVEQNLRVRTETADYVLRRYWNRSWRSAKYEVGVLTDLAEIGFPCAPPIKDANGDYLSLWGNWPAALFSFITGYSSPQPSLAQQEAVIEAVAWLHRATIGNERFLSSERWNYTMDFCRERLVYAARQSQQEDASGRLAWLLQQLGTVDIPVDLPRGICHCDFSASNMLFQGDTLIALLDFDDANYTWLVYDLANLMDNWCWSDGTTADWGGCARIVRLYSERRPLTRGERTHLFDVHRYQIVLDAAWFFDRGSAADFPERHRLEYFDSLGRAEYAYRLGLQ